MFYRTTSISHRAIGVLTEIMLAEHRDNIAKQPYEQLAQNYKSKWMLNKSLLKTPIAIGAYYLNNPQRFGHEPPKSYVLLRAYKAVWSLHKVSFGDCGKYRKVPSAILSRYQEQFWDALESDMRILARKVDDIERQRA